MGAAVRRAAMVKHGHIAGMLLGVAGFLVQLYGLLEGTVAIAVAGTAVLTLGLALYVMAKGRNPLAALWGLVPVMGPIVVLLQRPKSEGPSGPILDEILIEEDPHIRPAARTGGRAARPKVGVAGGWPLLIVMIPLGVLTILLSPWLPHVSAPEQTRPPIETPAPSPSVEVAVATPPPAPVKPPEEPVPAPKPAEPVPVKEPARVAEPPSEDDSVTKYSKLKLGMTYEEVREVVGKDGALLSGVIGGDTIVRWKFPDKAAFVARFHKDTLDRMTNLTYPPKSYAPLEMMAELTEDETQPSPEKAASAKAEDEPVEDGSEAAAESTVVAAGEEPDVENADAEQAKKPSVVRVGSSNPPPERVRKAKFPRYTQGIAKGPHDVVLMNGTTSELKVALRTAAKRGRDLTIPAGRAATVYLPNDTYSLYYIDPEKPEALQGGGSFSIASPPDTIRIQIR